VHDVGSTPFASRLVSIPNGDEDLRTIRNAPASIKVGFFRWAFVSECFDGYGPGKELMELRK
jgi:hypothetical protein